LRKYFCCNAKFHVRYVDLLDSSLLEVLTGPVSHDIGAH